MSGGPDSPGCLQAYARVFTTMAVQDPAKNLPGAFFTYILGFRV